MKTIVSDIETEKLENPEKLWLFGGIDAATGERYRFEPFRGGKEKAEAIRWAKTVDRWVGHNFISFDGPQLNRLLEPDLIDLHSIIDTMVVGKTIKYDRPIPKGCKSAHSLKAYGIRMGIHKGDFTAFHEYSEEMVVYWDQDLDVTMALFEEQKKYIYDSDWRVALRCEHDIQIELDQQKIYGFAFDTDKAKDILDRVNAEKERLEAEIQEDYPPELQEVAVKKYSLNKDGSEHANVQKARDKHVAVKIDGSNLLCYDYVPFNPGSPKQRVEKLWEAGWKPFEKTKTHQQFGRYKPGMSYKKQGKLTEEAYEEKKKHFEYYGWTVSEDNLKTLPSDAPPAAGKLARWLTLEGRRSSLVEWIGQVKEDGRIHGTVFGIGAWTQRCSHAGPNTANISSVWSTDKEGKKVPPKTPVDQVKHDYDTDMRASWIVPEGSWLVGVDAEGIQLRVLGDQLWRHFGKPDYATTIVNGKKEDETDIHNVNRKALRLEHVTRDDAKTFIYAWVLNAGIPKVASILQTSIPIASNARDRFESSIPGLKPFKADFLPAVANQGWFTGYDGRKVIVPNLHKTLAGILQNGETVVMKHARLRWTKELKGDMINFKPVGFIHDEWQTEVIGTKEEAEYVRQVQMKSIADTGIELGFKCPLSGSGSIGVNWAQTH